MQSQEHVSPWLTSIQTNYPQGVATIALLLKIKKQLSPTLVFTYSVGCIQDRGELVATGLSLADPSSLNYAKLRWRDPNTRGFLRTLAKAMQKVLTLSSLPGSLLG